MSKFLEDDLIRHRTSATCNQVVCVSESDDMYLVVPARGPYSWLASNYVDDNFVLVERRIHGGVQPHFQVSVDKAFELVLAFGPGLVHSRRSGKLAASARAYGTDMYASEKTDRRVKAAPPFKIDPNAAVPEDVAVTLEGIPQGYYLKAFRPAGPADLIIKTNGVICKESDHFVKKKSLIRPIVAQIPEANPDVPGIPAGYELVRVGSPHPGDLAIGYEGEVEECFIRIINKNRPIVRKKVNLTPCNGILPGIPLGYKVVRFGDVSPEEFYFDTVGNLKQGPSKHRLVVVKREVPLAFSGYAEIPRTSVDWGVVDRKVRQDVIDNFGYSGKGVTRNDTADAAAYAAGQLKQFEGRVHRAGKAPVVNYVANSDSVWTVQVENEYRIAGSGVLLWSVYTITDKVHGIVPTGRTRKVKVI